MSFLDEMFIHIDVFLLQEKELKRFRDSLREEQKGAKKEVC